MGRVIEVEDVSAPEVNERQESSSRSVFLLAGPSSGKFSIFKSVLYRTLKVICIRTVIKINKLLLRVFSTGKMRKTSKRSLD